MLKSPTKLTGSSNLRTLQHTSALACSRTTKKNKAAPAAQQPHADTRLIVRVEGHMSSNGKPREQPPVVSKIGHMQGGFIEGTVNREQLAKFGTSSPSTRSSQQVSAALSLMENVSSKRDITGKIDRAKFRGLEGGKVELPPNASTAPDLNPSPDARARGGLKHKAVVPGSSSPAAGNREASGVDAAAPSGCCIVS